MNKKCSKLLIFFKNRFIFVVESMKSCEDFAQKKNLEKGEKMKKMHNNLFLATACAGAMFMACSEESDSVANSVADDSEIVAEQDTVNTKDTVFVKDAADEDEKEFIFDKGLITGVSQKGPFAKGSSVTVFELDGTNSLNQTGRSFNGTISSNDGAFKVKNVSLVSSYVHLTATGAFRDEMTGNKSENSITLRALSDLDGGRSSVNVNLVTHLEYDRVAHLLDENPEMTLAEAKEQAEKEIFGMFYIDAGKFGYSEDLDIFGKDEANAALLAISVMLPMGNSSTEIMERLTALGEDMAEDGTWDDKGTLDSMAFWAQGLDLDEKLPDIRDNILSWNISKDVPGFEKYVRLFWNKYFGFGECGKDEPVGTVKNMPKGAAVKDAMVRYTCVDSAAVGKVWRVADDVEKDTMGLGREFEEGEMHKGLVNKDSVYVFDNGGFRHADAREFYLNKSCTKALEGTALDYEHSAYVCTNGLWEFDLENSEKGTVNDAFDDHVYKTVGIGGQVWMAENVKYNFGLDKFCYDENPDNCEKYGAIHEFVTALDGFYVDPGSDEYVKDLSGDEVNMCSYERGKCIVPKVQQGICPVGFHIPNEDDFNQLKNYVGLFNDGEGIVASLRSKDGWTDASASGTDRFGFNAYPAGWCDLAHYYIKNDQPVGKSNIFIVNARSKFVMFDADEGNIVPYSKGYPLAYVRCVKNSI